MVLAGSESKGYTQTGYLYQFMEWQKVFQKRDF